MTSAPPPAPPPSLPPSVGPPAWQPPPLGPPPGPPPGPPLGPLPGPPDRPPLQRSATDRIIGGVSGGLAEYTGIDALLWRVGFVALALAGGTGVIVYLLLWLFMPAGTSVPGGPGGPRAARRPAGPRSPVARITVATLLIVLGILALITRFTGLDPGPRGFLGAALLVVGLGLVAAAFATGRTARGGLIGLGAVLSLALIAASSEWHDRMHRVGDRTLSPASAAEVSPVYRAGLGEFTLDLSDIDVADLDRPIETRLDAGVGDVQILVPRSADVRVDVNSGIGSVRLFDQDDRSGGLFPGSGSADWTDDGRAELELTIDAGIGDVEVSRA